MEDYRQEARILAAGFEKGMTAFGESIERGLKAIAEQMGKDSERLAQLRAENDALIAHARAQAARPGVVPEVPLRRGNDDPKPALPEGDDPRAGRTFVDMREVHCRESFFHLPHEWTVRGGGAEGDEEVYCPGIPS